MNLLQLQETANKLVENAGDAAQHAHIRVSYRGKEYGVREITQFSVVPDAYIELCSIDKET